MSNLIAKYLGLALRFYVSIKNMNDLKLLALEVSSIFANKVSTVFWVLVIYCLPEMFHNQEAWNKSLFFSIVICFGRGGWRNWRVAKEFQVFLSFMNIKPDNPNSKISLQASITNEMFQVLVLLPVISFLSSHKITPKESEA